jgi:thiamine-phosphate pyrophosphorylase
MIPSPPIVCVITRARGLTGSPERLALLARLKGAAAAGAAFIQVRERQLSDRALVAFVRELVECTRDSDCRVMVNDRPDIAIAAGAAGVHLKERSLAVADVRRIVPGAFIVGRSVHTDTDAAAVEGAGGCDYLLFGTVFPSASKPDEHPIAGIDALRRVCERVSLPVLAIGGINTDRASSVAAAGAAGAAGISLFSEATDMGAAVRALQAALTPPSGMSKVARNE